ncbi:MAG TPA: putative molybdenum carrier protein, partial [Rhodothermales bacterium]|nr:putative molybdenum carrier protein [Rhodothermales bacterium]
TLILRLRAHSKGTDLTVKIARRLAKPCLILDTLDAEDARRASEWLNRHKIRTLNVAGPRESEAPGAYTAVRTFLHHLFNTDSNPRHPTPSTTDT